MVLNLNTNRYTKYDFEVRLQELEVLRSELGELKLRESAVSSKDNQAEIDILNKQINDYINDKRF